MDAAAATGSISGRVTVPAGVDVTKVQVNLWVATPKHTESTWPASDGTYRFDGLPAGNYNVEFIGWDQGLIHALWNPDPNAPVWPIALGAGQAITGINATLKMGATLTGTIKTNGSFDLTRVRVWVIGLAGVFPDAEVLPDGRWTIRGVPTGKFMLSFDGSAAGLGSLLVPSNGTYHSVTAPEAKTGLDVTLNGAIGEIAGRVSVPAAGSPASVLVKANGPLGATGAASVAADGTFRMRNLPVGSYKVRFVVAGSWPEQVLEYWRDSPTAASATPVTVRQWEVTQINPFVAAATAVTATSSKPVAHVGDPLVLRARVTSAVTGFTGSVEFRNGDVVLGTAPLLDEWAELDVGVLPQGKHTITARYLGGKLHEQATGAFTQWVSEPVAPVVSRVEPPAGSTLGGTRVNVTGSGLTDASVTFGGAAGTDVLVLSPEELQVTTPPGVGAAPVVVTGRVGSDTRVSGYRYVDLVTRTPERVWADWETRPNQIQCLKVTGLAGVPAAATGVIVNVTTVRPSGPGYVVMYPDTAGTGATSPPGGSTVNFEPGADVANSAFVALTPNGRMCHVTRGAPSAGVLIDVTGYLLAGSGVTTQTSTRLLDTRPGASHVGSVTGPVRPREVYTIQVAGLAGVPADAESVLLNVTVTGAMANGNLRVFPGGATVPGTSTLNYAPGATKANAAIVSLADGKISFYSDSPVSTGISPVQVILDVVGYTRPGSSYVGVAPTRVVDTRPAFRTGPLSGPLAARTVYSLPLAGVDPVPDDATAVVLNVTAIDPTGNGNLRVYPDSNADGRTPPPGASSINYIRGRAVPNQIVVALPSNGRINFWSDMGSGGKVHLAVDVVGYVTIPSP